MKPQHFYQDKNQRPAGAAHQASAGELNQNKIEFIHAPSAREVATRAYFSYANQGFPHGRDVQHWLEAESEILTERNLTRTHGYPNQK